MSERKTLDQFGGDAGSDAVADQIGGGIVLFRYTSDQYVNEAVADLARELNTIRDGPEVVDVEPDRIVLRADAKHERVIDDMESIIWNAGNHTHRRKAVAHAINRALQDMGHGHDDERWVPPSSIAFPESADEDVTVYPDKSVDEMTLSDHGIPPEKIDANVTSKTSLYRLSEQFVGNNQYRNFSSQRDRFKRYFEVFREVVVGDQDPDDTACMVCGSTIMPAYKGPDGEDLEYNQSFTLFASASGQAKPLGQRSRTTSHRGRCAACLVAGFYYTFMPKIVRPTASNENDTRIFAPVGDFEELVRIREDLTALLEDIDRPTESGYTRQQTIGNPYTNSFGMQTVDFYEVVRRHLNAEYSGDLFERELEHRPTGLASYVSKVGQTRVIRAMQSIDPDTWAYQTVARRSTSSDDSYWPFADVLAWFDHVDGDATRGLTEDKDDLAFGILKRDLVKIERAVFQFAKTIERNAGENVEYSPNKAYLDDYFDFIMSQSVTRTESIDAEAIDSIRRVASSLGQLFHTGDDIGVLIQLQNASTATEFLKAFEKAAMQAQKKSVDEPPTQWQTSRDDNVAEVLRLISDPETFEPAKRMFVIHTSLAAQYQNVQTTDEADVETGGDDA